MEEGTKTKRTVFVGGIGDDVDEEVLINAFSTFGNILEVQIPPAQMQTYNQEKSQKHRGFAFVTYTSAGDAQDAIDNMDLNELRGRVLRVNLARSKVTIDPGAGNRAVWESEEWLKNYAKPLSESGGLSARARSAEAEAAELEERKPEEDADEGEDMEE